MKHSFDDTIVAIATPVGVGGVGVVRTSGGQSIRISSKIIQNFPKDIEPRRVYHGWVVQEGKPVDEVLYYFMKSPESYTGEDVVEISGHGGPVVLRKILDLTIRAGARLANRGEFTRRAFLNGKVDLLQVEAILDLVSAKTDRGIDCSIYQLDGRLSRRIQDLRRELIGMLAGIEASIDFPDDVEGLDLEREAVRLKDALQSIEVLLGTADEGRIIREGIRTAIVGKPNVGKSSLLNALLGEDRAIVTAEPGTTRDTIEEVINLSGLPLVVVDTAGIRHPKDRAEEFGVERARWELGRSDMALVVIDASQELSEEDLVVLNEARGRRGIVVLNKTDLGCRVGNNCCLPNNCWVSLNGRGDGFKALKVSALTGVGIEDLKQEILQFVGMRKIAECDDFGRINSRHKECLVRARESLMAAAVSMEQGMPEDFVAIDLKAAIVALGEISGEEVSEEVVNAIFDNFCVGK